MDDIQGLEALRRKLQDIGEAAAGDSLGEALLAGGAVLEGKIKISMHEPKHGARYGAHVASAPGEAPAIDIGLLVNSVQTKLVKATATGAEVDVFTNAEAAEPLEFGTGHLAARPFMRPALDEGKEEIGEAVRVTLARKIEEAAK